MTIQERLQEEAATLSDVEALRVLEFVAEQKRLRLERDASGLPGRTFSFEAIGRSGWPDLGSRSEEILREGFGKD